MFVTLSQASNIYFETFFHMSVQVRICLPRRGGNVITSDAICDYISDPIARLKVLCGCILDAGFIPRQREIEGVVGDEERRGGRGLC